MPVPRVTGVDDVVWNGHSVPLTADLGWLLGVFLAEGSYYKRGLGGMYRRGMQTASVKSGIQFSLNNSETGIVNGVIRILRQQFWSEGRWNSGKNGVQAGCLRCNGSQELTDFFRWACGEYSWKKRLAPALFQSNREFIRGVVAGFAAGDGTVLVGRKHYADVWQLKTVSKQLAWQLMQMLLQLKVSPSMFTAPGGGGKNPRAIHAISVFGREISALLPRFVSDRKWSAAKYRRSRNFLWAPVISVGATHGPEPVFNLTVEGSTFVAGGVGVHNCGFAMGCCCGSTEVQRRVEREDGMPEWTLEKVPLGWFDFLMSIKAPPFGQIIFADIRGMIYALAKHGFRIVKVSFDAFGSISEVQELDRKGYDVEQLSVDTSMDPYLYLRAMLQERRGKYYAHPVLMKELVQLEHRKAKKKVGHPAFAGGCFVGSTRVPLLDGTTRTMEELVGQEVWVYSSLEDGRIVPGKARGRQTRFATELVDVELDNGAVLRCTPEHLWRLRDGVYKPAADLVPNVDRLMRITRGPAKGGYERIADSFYRRQMTHQIVYEAMYGPVPNGCEIHHRNECKRDNRPENLHAPTKQEHDRQHAIARHAADPQWRERQRVGTIRFNNSPEGRQRHSEALRRTLRSKPPEWWKWKATLHPAYRGDIDLSRLLSVVDVAENANEAARLLSCSRNTVVRVLRENGLDSWEAFKAAQVGANHKVVRIIPVHLGVPVPVYDLEVETHSNFALDAGVFVHNSKDLADAAAGCLGGSTSWG